MALKGVLKELYDVNQILKVTERYFIDTKDKEFFYYDNFHQVIYKDKGMDLIFKEFGENNSIIIVNNPKGVFKFLNANKANEDLTMDELFKEGLVSLYRSKKELPLKIKDLVYSLNSKENQIVYEDKDTYLALENYGLNEILETLTLFRQDTSHLVLIMEFDLETDTIFMRREKSEIDFDSNFFFIIDSKVFPKFKVLKSNTSFMKFNFYDNNILELIYGHETKSVKVRIQTIYSIM
jgi:hypothetical protein